VGQGKESIIDLLIKMPWWVSVLVSGLALLFLRALLPLVDFGNMTINSFAKGISGVAPFIAIVLLIPAPMAAFNGWRKRRILDNQKGIDSIRALSWREFEELVGEAYRRQDYRVIENTTVGPDEGIDLVLKKDGRLALVQCKHWKSAKVGVNIIRELLGVMSAEQASNGIVITSGVFTQEAKNFAADKPLDLIEGKQLVQLIDNVRKQGTTMRKPFPADVCPKCGGELILRTTKIGQSAGQKFRGCSNFPKCRFTKSQN
jgi:restriction system protein